MATGSDGPSGPASGDFRLVLPEEVDEAIRLLAEGPEVLPLAGGTDLLVDLDQGRYRPRTVVSLARLPWRTLERTVGELVIGSTLPLRTLERDPSIAVDLPGLAEAIGSVGGISLRHRATIGGNLVRASPASDLLPVLLALGTTVDVVGPAGPRSLPLERFVRGSRSVDLGPGELVRSVRLPRTAPSAYVWQRVRPAHDISQVGVAVARPDPSEGWRIALGGVLPTATRVASAEEEVRDARPTAVAIARAARRAADAANFTTDRRATEPYRRRLVDVLVRRALERAAGGAVGSGA